MKINLERHTALVTGASGELGRVIAKTLASCGADVAIHYLSGRRRAETVADQVTGFGRKAVLVQGDVTDPDSVARMKDEATQAIGPIDIVINNAVSQYEWKTVLEQPAEDYLDQFQTCVMQNVLMAKAFVPEMITRGWGRVIAINTECAMQNLPNQSAYVSGKRGMDGALRVLAREVGHAGVTVNQVAPGWMISDKYRGSEAASSEAYEAKVPLRRRGEDQDVANAVAFLASDLAGYISGCYLPVCGGNVMPAI